MYRQMEKITNEAGLRILVKEKLGKNAGLYVFSPPHTTGTKVFVSGDGFDLSIGDSSLCGAIEKAAYVIQGIE